MTGSERIILSGDSVVYRDEYGLWKLLSNGVVFSLADFSDFRRIVSLLEMPVENVKLALGFDFPYMRVAEVGLKHGSDYWIKLAISWVAHSSAEEANSLVGNLKELSVDKAVSQSNRHLARKELRRLLNG